MKNEKRKIRSIQFSIAKLNIFKHDKENRIPIFHHIPKCGGQSLLKVLEKWFKLEQDYVIYDWDKRIKSYPAPKNLFDLNPKTCLTGHWDSPFSHLSLETRYPQILTDQNRYFLFTFLRNPLDLRISWYYFRLLHYKGRLWELETDLAIETNFIAKTLGVNQSNFRSRLDRYDFIGFLEDYNNSVKELANLLGKRMILPPKINISPRKKDAIMTDEQVSAFKEANALDYMIYDYAIKRHKS